MRNILFLIVTFTFIGLISTASFAGPNLPSPKSSTETIDRVIAIVNNDVITQQEFNAAMSQVTKMIHARHATLPPPAELKRGVLNQLIYKKLQLQLVKRAKIKISNKQVNAAIKNIAERNHVSVKSALQHMHAAGLTRKELRQQIAISKLQHEAVAKQVDVTDDDVNKVMHEYQQQQQNKTLYHVADYLVPLTSSPSSSEIAKAKTKIKNLRTAVLKGKKENYNDLGWQSATNLPDIFLNKITKLKPGQVSQPIQAGNGFHIIKLLGVHDNNQSTFTRAQAYQVATNMQAQKAIKKWLQQLRQSAYVKIVVPQ
jgi:peptidyl-prolyl cis-trans isomerase SurA